MVLFTGTAVVPPPGLIFRAGDGAFTAASGLGELRIVVMVAGLRRLEEGWLRCGRYGGMPGVTCGWRRCRRLRRQDRASCSSR